METSHRSWIQGTYEWLRQSGDEPETESILAAIASGAGAELEALLEVLLAGFDALAASQGRWRIAMQAIATRLLEIRNADKEDGEPSPLIDPSTLAQLYDRLGEIDAHAAAHCLQILAAQSDEESLDTLAGIISDSPPRDWQTVGLALSPLWNAPGELLELFFERLDEGLLQPAAMTVLLDLANYSQRRGKLSAHPWQSRDAELSHLLDGVCRRLSELERDPKKFGGEVADVQRILGDSLALTIALCDSLGLIGNPDAEASLKQAMALSHRRVQAEAAAALTRIGSELGRQRLVELASDPMARKRAVVYAEELGFVEDIEETMRHPQALAESELVSWLASPERFGLAPQAVELVDASCMLWPSFEEPQNCYLFRYTYQVPNGELSNIGIVGPVTHAFNADLTHLPLDEVYAAFAGWQAEHEDIFEVPMPLLNPAQRREADRLLESLEEQELLVSEAIALTFFMGELAILAIVEHEGRKLCAITDGQEYLSYAVSDGPTSMTPDLVLAIFRGRKLLRTFNP
jgi:hypothetical protein